MMMHAKAGLKTCYVSLGSNLPDGYGYVMRAMEWLRNVMVVERCSDIYTTPSVSLGDDSMYFNAVARCITDMTASQLELMLKQYESESGRRRDADCHCVVIDLDLVVFDDVVLRPRDAARDYFRIGLSQLGNQ